MITLNDLNEGDLFRFPNDLSVSRVKSFEMQGVRCINGFGTISYLPYNTVVEPY